MKPWQFLCASSPLSVRPPHPFRISQRMFVISRSGGRSMNPLCSVPGIWGMWMLGQDVPASRPGWLCLVHSLCCGLKAFSRSVLLSDCRTGAEMLCALQCHSEAGRGDRALLVALCLSLRYQWYPEGEGMKTFQHSCWVSCIVHSRSMPCLQQQLMLPATQQVWKHSGYKGSRRRRKNQQGKMSPLPWLQAEASLRLVSPGVKALYIISIMETPPAPAHTE